MIARRLGALIASAFMIVLLGPQATQAVADFSDFGLESTDASRSDSQAGIHTDLNLFFEVKTDPTSPEDFTGLHEPYARTKNVTIELPPGFTGNPNAVPACTNEEFVAFTTNTGPGCPQDTQVGVAKIGIYNLQVRLTVPIFNMVASGNSVARLGYYTASTTNVINVRLRPDDDYAVSATLEGLTPNEQLVFSDSEIWAVPADPSHDTMRLTPRESYPLGLTSSPPRPSDLDPVAFFTGPTNCTDDPEIGVTIESYQLPGVTSGLLAPLGKTTGCDLVPFDPGISLEPTTNRADSPSGMDVRLSVDQTELLVPDGVAPAHIKKTIVTLPEGMSLNPAAASGLDRCSTEKIGLVSKSPIRFNSSDPRCPNGSKVGTATVTTPVLDGPIEGSLYVADQADNPFDTLLSGYLVAQGRGVLIKLAGRFDVTPSGRITATFDNAPQQPFSEFELHFKGGDRGVLITPSTCGTYEITSQFVPWSADDPNSPGPDEVITRVSKFTIDSGPNGSPCPSGQFDPALQAGSVSPFAGQFSSFVLRVTRSDGTQRIAGLSAFLPAGLTAKLAGVPYCPEAAIQAAAARSGLGQGGLELTNPSCPSSSEVAQILAGAGAGPMPFYVNTGRAFLAGPYRGAPLSMVAVFPAVAGPFDLGTVVERVALHVDPESARVAAISDPIPTILHGIPLDLRDIRVVVNRPEFALNPTNCEEKRVIATLVSEQERTASPADRFQVGGCGALDFKPKLRIRLFGKTNRGAHPRLRAVLTARPGDANIGRAVVAMPRSEFLDQDHIRTVCTRVQFAADQCPKGSVYGRARAMTPLLDQPLEGPVYLRSSSDRLPNLVAALDGQIDVDVVGRIDSVRKGGIRTTFASVPDAPVSKFVLTMQGGRRGLLVNSRNLCGAPAFATATFIAQNGRRAALAPRVNNACPRLERKMRPR
jgi:hypothetical protein